MSHRDQTSIGSVFKTLFVTALKLAIIALVFVLKVVGTLSIKLAETLEKFVGHGSGH